MAPDNPAPEKDDESYMKRVTDSGNTNQAPPVNEPKAGGDRREEIKKLLEAAADKHFVFFFGSPASGKTATLGAILHSLHRPESVGRIFIHGKGEGFFSPGLALWNRIQSSFNDRRFPPRTGVGETIQLHAEFRPNGNAPSLDLVFLEISGEDLKNVEISTSGDRTLPFHINQFLRVPSLKMVFVITTSWEDATRDDPVIDSFLSYVNDHASHLLENRFILLVTKWDRKSKNADEDVDSFVRRTMPATYNKLSHRRNILQAFSVGTVIPFSPDGKPHPDDIIDKFNHEESQGLFDRIYQTFHGHGLLENNSFFKRLWKKLFGK